LIYELPRRKQRGILKSIEHPKGRGLVRRVYGGLVCLLPASGWLAGWRIEKLGINSHTQRLISSAKKIFAEDNGIIMAVEEWSMRFYILLGDGPSIVLLQTLESSLFLFIAAII